MKKIAYKDFKRESKMLGMATGTMQTAVEAANRWISTEKAEARHTQPTAPAAR